VAWDVFYVVISPDQHRVKFGITSGDARRRLRQHRRRGYTSVTRLLTGLPDATARDIENAVQAALKLAGAKPVLRREYYDVSFLDVVLDIADNYPVRTAA
jgi:hypothetical protein